MYISDMKKYDGSSTKSLSYKFNIFMNLYNRAKILSEILFIAFSIILKFMALEHYYFSYLSDLII